MTISTAADIAGDNAVHALGSAGMKARSIILTASGGTARFGDLANVGASRGVLLPQNVPVTINASDGDISDSIALEKAGAYVPTGTTLTRSFCT